MSYSSVKELMKAFSEEQNRVAGNLAGQSGEIKNGDIVKILEVDILIRKADKAAGNKGWIADYCRKNVSDLPGQDIIEKTESLVELLRREGVNEPNTRSDFPLRNPKHVFDDVPEEIIEPLLPAINAILA